MAIFKWTQVTTKVWWSAMMMTMEQVNLLIFEMMMEDEEGHDDHLCEFTWSMDIDTAN